MQQQQQNNYNNINNTTKNSIIKSYQSSNKTIKQLQSAY